MVLPNGSRPNDFIVLMRPRVISIDAPVKKLSQCRAEK